MDCHSLLQRIFWTQGSNLGLLHCRQILYWLSYREVLLCAVGWSYIWNLSLNKAHQLASSINLFFSWDIRTDVWGLQQQSKASWFFFVCLFVFSTDSFPLKNYTLIFGGGEYFFWLNLNVYSLLIILKLYFDLNWHPFVLIVCHSCLLPLSQS